MSFENLLERFLVIRCFHGSAVGCEKCFHHDWLRSNAFLSFVPLAPVNYQPSGCAMLGDDCPIMR